MTRQKTGEALALEKLDLIEEASQFLRNAPQMPLPVLLRLYQCRRLDAMSVEQLRDFISKGRAGTLWNWHPRRRPLAERLRR